MVPDKDMQLRAAYVIYEHEKADALRLFGNSKEYLEAKYRAWNKYCASLRAIDPEQFCVD